MSAIAATEKLPRVHLRSQLEPAISVSLQSRIGLNTANFFLAEVTGVVMPFLGTFLQSRQWRYDSIGIAMALAGLGVFLMQTPAGFIVDRVSLAARAAWAELRCCWVFATGWCPFCRRTGGWSIRCCSWPARGRRFSCRCWGRWHSGWSVTRH